MLVDFHSHFGSKNSIFCTDTPEVTIPDSALLRCIGLLPDKWTKELEDKLYQKLSADVNLHLGEVGLDRRFESIMPMEGQTQALEREIRFATSLGRCISLHCVRETGMMVKLLSKFNFRPFSILWHGFTGSAETASELYRRSVVISIGPNFRGDCKEVFKANPMLVLETDYTGADSSEHDRILTDHYTSVSSSLGMKTEELAQHCMGVFESFGHIQKQ